MTRNEAMAELGIELRAQRKAAGKTIQQFAFELGISDRQLRRYERGRCFPPEFRLKHIAQLLDLEPGFFIRFFRSPAQKSAHMSGMFDTSRPMVKSSHQSYLAGTFLELMEAGYSQHWLLSEAVRLEQTHPADEIVAGFAGSNAMGDVSKWNELTSANAETAFGVIKNDRMIAYWFCIPVKKRTYQRAVAGENINAEIQLNDVAFFDFPRSYDFYFVDLYQASDAPPWVVNKLLLDGFLNLLKSLAQSGHFVRRMCTHAYAVETERICEKSGFKYIADHKYHARLDGSPDQMRHTRMYEIELLSDELPALLRYDDDLAHLYQSEVARVNEQNSGRLAYRETSTRKSRPSHTRSI